MSYRLTVLGTGYLGTAQAACLASLGFEVLGVDTDPARVQSLSDGTVPFHEPGLEPLLRAGLAAGRLSFTTSYAEAAAFGDIHFICVGTPQADGSYRADLSQLDQCIGTVAPLLSRAALVVGKCTVPVGTAAHLAERLSLLAPQAELAWCPEFLREGHAVADTLRPDRVVAGVQSDRAAAMLRDVHAGPIAAGAAFLVTDPNTAELVKVAANAFLATKISFINAMAQVCEAAHGDVHLLAEALGHDPPTVGVLGAAFKPGSDDIRDSPALDVAKTIASLGATVTVYDPVAMPRARRAHPELGYASSAVEAARDADMVLLLTEWAEFRDADPELLGSVVAKRNIVDGRNALDPARWRAASWHYRALGRPTGAGGMAVSRPQVALITGIAMDADPNRLLDLDRVVISASDKEQ